MIVAALLAAQAVQPAPAPPVAPTPSAPTVVTSPAPPVAQPGPARQAPSAPAPVIRSTAPVVATPPAPTAPRPAETVRPGFSAAAPLPPRPPRPALGITATPTPTVPTAKPIETNPKALGLRVATSGAFAQLARFAIEKDIRELIDANRGLPTADQAALGKIAIDQAVEAQKRLTAAIGETYAEQLSVADMQAIIAFNESPAAARWRAAEPGAVAALQKAMAGYDFKREVLEIMCFRTRKACPSKDAKK